ncbi:MAG: hypothetical protein HYY49_03355 [Ignavibacteriales bacterium]|nr:hypothetical protein [Ignavibacteriales bacterium]
MIPVAFQRDFGGFDSKFLGITIRFEDPSLWELYVKCNSIGRNPLDVVKVGNEALRSGTARAFQVFSVVTTLAHEARHFHDSLLSPYGNHLFRIRTNAAINGLQSIGSYINGRKILPVPVTRWKQKTPDELAWLNGYWRKVFKIDEDSTPPRLSGDQLRLSKQTEAAYNMIKNLVRNPETDRLPYRFQPAHVFEASGILAQIQNVYTVFGVDHTNLFMEVLFKSQDASRYTLPLRILSSLFDKQKRPMDTAIMSIIIHWCIMGDYTIEKYGACPTVRFARLVDYLSKVGLPSPDARASDLYRLWTRDLKVVPIEQALENTLKVNERSLDTLDGFPSYHRETFADLIDTFRSRVSAAKTMKDLFLAIPDSYVRPYQHQENLSNWVAAPIRVDFIGSKLVSSEESLLPVFSIQTAIKLEDGKLAVSRAIMNGQTEGVKVIDSEKAASANDLITLVDFCFSDFCRDEPDFDIARRTLRKEGLFAFELLN